MQPQSITKWGYSTEASWILEAAGFDLVYCGELETEAIQLWIGSSFNICRSSMIMTYEIAAHWWGNHNQFPRPWWRIAFPLNQLSHVSGTYATSQVSPSKHTHRSLKSAVNSFVWWRTLCIPVVMDLLALNYGPRLTCKHWIFHRIRVFGLGISAAIEMCVVSYKPSITWKVKVTKSSTDRWRLLWEPCRLENSRSAVGLILSVLLQMAFIHLCLFT